MGVVRQLAFAEFRHHRVRTILTVLSVSLAVALIVAMTSGFSSLHSAARSFVVQYFGTTDVQVVAGQDARGEVNQKILDELRADGEVKQASGVLKFIKPVLRKSGKPTNKVTWTVGVPAPGTEPGNAAAMLNSGRWFTKGERGVVVVDERLAESIELKLGEEMLLPRPDGKPVKMKVVGMAAKPSILAFRRYSVYAPIDDIREIHDHPGAYSEINVDLNEGVDRKAFVARWKEQLSADGETVQLKSIDSMEATFNQNMKGLMIISYLGGVIAMLAAGFIVFSTVSMGLTERTRVLAMLRAVGASQQQIGQLVVMEALLIGLGGIVLGVIIGWAGLWAVVSTYDKWFVSGATLSVGGLLFATLGMAVVTVVAGIIPAWSASRVDPLQAMTPLSKSSSRKLLPICFMVGLFLIAADTLVLKMDWLSSDVRWVFHIGAGMPSLMVGLFL